MTVVTNNVVLLPAFRTLLRCARAGVSRPDCFSHLTKLERGDRGKWELERTYLRRTFVWRGSGMSTTHADSVSFH